MELVFMLGNYDVRACMPVPVVLDTSNVMKGYHMMLGAAWFWPGVLDRRGQNLPSCPAVKKIKIKNQCGYRVVLLLARHDVHNVLYNTTCCACLERKRHTRLGQQGVYTLGMLDLGGWRSL